MDTSTPADDFRFGLGHPVLEFLATLAGRQRQPQERLVTPADLDRWLALAGLACDANCSVRQLTEARDLREAIFRLLEAARHSRPPVGDDIEMVNGWARRAKPVPQLGARLELRRDAPNACTAPLAELAAAAIDLIGGPERDRVHNCGDPTCSLMFIDRSRPGRRHWCSMERCGNRAKTARYRRQRRRDQKSAC